MGQMIANLKKLCCLLVIFHCVAAGQAEAGIEQCFVAAEKVSGVPSALLSAVAHAESGGRQDVRNTNRNGTVDVGIMQINSWWKQFFDDEDWQKIENMPCANVLVGSLILRRCLTSCDTFWEGISCYNTGSCKKRNRLYEFGIYSKLVSQNAETSQ